MSDFYKIVSGEVFRNTDSGVENYRYLCKENDPIYLCVDSNMNNVFSHGNESMVQRHFNLAQQHIGNDNKLQIVKVTANPAHIYALNNILAGQVSH